MKLNKIKTMVISSSMILASLTAILTVSFTKSASKTNDVDPIQLVNDDSISQYRGRTLQAANSGTSLSSESASVSVRMGDVPGMRFRYDLSASVVNGAFTTAADSLNDYTYGVIVAQSENLNPYSLDELFQNEELANSVKNASTSGLLSYNGDYGTIKLYNSIAVNKAVTEDGVSFASVLMGFENVDEASRTKMYNSGFTSIAYVSNGDEIYFTSTAESSYMDAVKTYLANPEEYGLSAEQVEALNSLKTSNTIHYVLTGKTETTLPCFSVDHGSSYTFRDTATPGTYISTNKGQDSETATMVVTILDDGVLTFDYEVSTESGWDKCNIKQNNTTILKDASGVKSDSIELTVAKGDKITFTYSKDGSGEDNNDTFTIKNIDFVSNQGAYTQSQLVFDSMGGTAVDTILGYNGFAINEPNNPTREGYRFDGWYTSASYDVAFDFDAGLTQTTKVYAKWVEQVKVNIYDGSNLIISADVDKNSAFTPSQVIPVTFTKIIHGYYTDSALANEWIVGSEVNANLDLYVSCTALEDMFAPSGVLASVINKADYADVTSSVTTYNWTMTKQDNGLMSLSSTNEGKGSSASSITFVVQKDTLLTFAYSGSSESGYDKFQVYVKSADATSWGKANLEKSGYGDNAYNGTHWVKLHAGDSVSLAYKKDDSGNNGDDKVTITDLQFTDGIPTAKVNYVYNDGKTANDSYAVEYYGMLDNRVLAEPNNVRSEELYHFGGWYYDEALTNKVEKGALMGTEDVTLYAKWLEKVTVTFVVPVGDSSFSFNANGWTETPIEIENPSIANHAFRGWYTDATYAEEVDISAGVLEDCTLYAKFEPLSPLVGDYKGVETYGKSNGSGNNSSNKTGSIQEDLTLMYESSARGVIDLDSMKETGETQMTKDGSTYYVWMFEDKNTIIFNYSSSKTSKLSDDVYIMVKTTDTVSITNQVVWSKGLERIVELTYGTTTETIYINAKEGSEAIYFDVEIKDLSGTAMTIADVYNSSKWADSLWITSNGNDVVKLAYKGNDYVALDGTQGTYTGSLGTIVLDGAGKATVGDVAEVPYVVNGNKIELTMDNVTKTITLSEGTYVLSTDGTEGTYTGEYGTLVSNGDGTATLDGCSCYL